MKKKTRLDIHDRTIDTLCYVEAINDLCVGNVLDAEHIAELFKPVHDVLKDIAIAMDEDRKAEEKGGAE